MALSQEWSVHDGNPSSRLRLHTAFVREWSTHVEEAVTWLRAATEHHEGCQTSKVSSQDDLSDADCIDQDAHLPLEATWPTEFEIEELEDELVKFQVDLERLRMSCRIAKGNDGQGQIERECEMARCESESDQVVPAKSSEPAALSPHNRNATVTPTSALLQPSSDTGSGTTDSTTASVGILAANDCDRSSSVDLSRTQAGDANYCISANLPSDTNSIAQDSTNAPHTSLGVSSTSNMPFRSIEDLAEQLLAFKVDIERLRMSFTLAPDGTTSRGIHANEETPNREQEKTLGLATLCPKAHPLVKTPTSRADKENCNDEALNADTKTMLSSTISNEVADDNYRYGGFSTPMVISARGITMAREFADDSLKNNGGAIRTPCTSTWVPNCPDSPAGTPINKSTASTPINASKSLAATSSTIMQQLQNKSHAEQGETPTRTTKKSTLHAPVQVAKVAKSPSVSSPVGGKKSPRQLDKRSSSLQPTVLHCRQVGSNAQQYLAQEMLSSRQRGRKPAIQQGLQRHQGDLGARSM